MKLRNIAIVALLGASLAGCKKTWLDVNTNPNTLPTSTPDYVFTNGLTRMSSASGNLLSDETGSYYAGLWTQSSSYILSGITFSYLYTNTDFNYWDGWYDVLADFEFVDQQADAKNQKFFKGPAKIMKALLYQQVVDAYGNAPYSEGLQGVKILTPKFDAQKDIYEGLIKNLDTAIALIRANPFSSAYNTTDVMFNGSSTKWIQFANSLKLRILIRQARITGRDAYIIAEIKKAAAAPEGFLASGLDAGVNPGFLATAGKTNPYYDRWGYTAAGAVQSLGRFPRPTKFLIDFYKSSGDSARMKRNFYAVGGENGSNPGVSVKAEINDNYVGVPFGAGSGYTAGTCSPIGPSQIIKGQYAKKFILFTAAESNLLLAEAKFRYNISELPKTAQEYYEQGVKESYRLVGASSAAATTLLSNGVDLADWSASTDKLKAIWMQKWLALANFNGFEAWCEYRQNNYPNTPQSLAASGTDRPLRLFYPATEQGSNEANVKAQGNINALKDKLFWDVD